MERSAKTVNPDYNWNPATNVILRLETSPTDFRLCLRQQFACADDILENEITTLGWFMMLMTHCPPFVHMDTEERQKLVKILVREDLRTRLARTLAAVYDSPDEGSDDLAWVLELAKTLTGPAKDPIEKVDVNFAKMLL